MKKDDKYRFSLQFGMDTEEKVQVGEFLERLGNKKSEWIVEVLAEHISNNPALFESGKYKPLQIVVKPTITYEQVESMVRNAITEKLSETTLSAGIKLSEGHFNQPGINDDDIATMVSNLDIFSSP